MAVRQARWSGLQLDEFTDSEMLSMDESEHQNHDSGQKIMQGNGLCRVLGL